MTSYQLSILIFPLFDSNKILCTIWHMTQLTPISVSKLNTLVKSLLDTHLESVLIEGEISNLMKASSGHWYFSLKDQNAQISCVCFKQYQQGIDLKQGDQVQILAKVTLYEARGTYQCIVYNIMPVGFGAKQAEFERLKKKLNDEGLFAEDKKRAIPSMPQRIGLITSAQGAAVHDILNILKKRMPMIRVTIFPAMVQGIEAAQTLVDALEKAYAYKGCDAFIITRGGGSIEDLWPFNDEQLARKIAASPKPIISAVGHEVDFTIADFVADKRAPTPSGAAEIISPDQAYLKTQLEQINWQLHHRMQQKVEAVFEQVKQFQQRLLTPSQLIERLKEKIGHYFQNLNHAQQKNLQSHQHNLSLVVEKIEILSPLKTLKRGYGIILNKNKKAISSVKQLSPKEDVKIKLEDGSALATIKELI